MPYIDREARKNLDKEVDNLIAILPEASSNYNDPGGGLKDGDVNYVITRIIDAFYNKSSYAIMERGIGLLECIKQEFYRKVISKYEDTKIIQNGDVYK